MSERSTLSRAATAVAASVRDALGADGASVQVALPDGSGKLRVVGSAGDRADAGRKRSSRRRHVFETGRDVVVPRPAHDRDMTMSILPLRVDDETVGVLEMTAPADRLSERREAILALVRQSAAFVKISLERAETERSARGLERLLFLDAAANAASGPVAAMRVFAGVCSEHMGIPIAVARPDRSHDGWYLAASAGMGRRRESLLRRDLQGLTVHDLRRPEVETLSRIFGAVIGRPATAVPTGEAVVLVGQRGSAPFIAAATSILERTLGRLTGRNGAPDDVGMGIAWTAHELRGPLVGARAALEHVLSSEATVDRGDLLRRTKAELDRLTDIVDPLLQWSVGRGTLRKQPADLVEIAHQAMTSAALDTGRRVVLEGPDRMPIHADVVQLRSALANVIRNSLVHAPHDSPVEVTVEDRGSFASVSIRDRGPGIPPDERTSVFDPFVRGRSAYDGRSGRGLGLFIARRVAEAHGGNLTLEPTRIGASFRFDLPIEG